MDDLISRQAAIDVLRVAYWDKDIQSAKDDPCIVDAMTDWAIRQIKDVPSAQPEIAKRTAETAQNVSKSDLISRKAAIEAVSYYIHNVDKVIGTGKLSKADCRDAAENVLEALPSAQPEIKPISYEDCSNAMLMMWMDNVLTDGEYNRIMDKLNEFEKKRRADDGSD